jgi:hypothetical protein
MQLPYIIVEAGAPHIVNELPKMRANRLGVIYRFWEGISAFDQEFESDEARLFVEQVLGAR